MTTSQHSSVFQASPLQRGLYTQEAVGNRRPGAPTGSFVQLVVEAGTADAAAVGAAAGRLAARHEILRSTLTATPGGEVGQAVSEADADNASQAVRTASAADADELAALLRTERDALDVAAGPGFRVLLATGPDAGTQLVLTAHGAIADQASLRLLAHELLTGSNAGTETGTEADTEEVFQYADFAAWHHDLLADADGAEERAAWAGRLEELRNVAAEHATATATATNTSASASSISDTATPATAHLDENLVRALDEFAQSRSLEPAHVLAGAFAAACWRFEGERDLLAGVVVPARPDAVREAIGAYERVVPLLCAPSAQDGAEEFIGRFATDAQTWGDRIDYLDPARLQDIESGLITVRYSAEPELPSGAKVLAERSGVAGAAQLTAIRTGDAVDLELDTPGSVLARPQELLASFRILLADLLERPAAALGELATTTEADRGRVLRRGAGPDAEVTPVLEAFAASCSATPDAVAVADSLAGAQLSYRDLDSRSAALAGYLAGHGVGRGAKIVVSLERTADLLVAIVGVLKTGAAFVLVDPAHPRERLAYVLEDTQAAVLLCTAARASGLTESASTRIVVLEEEWAAIAAGGHLAPAVTVDPEDPAYVLYTSGSTGQPSGVVVPHRGLANYLAWSAEAYRMGEGTGVLAHSSISFDFTLTTLLSPLVAGQKVILVRESAGAVSAVAEALRSHRDLSVVKLTPTHLEVLGQLLTAEELAGATRTLVVGGEALTGRVAALFASPGTVIVNEYGPTETVVGSTVHRLPADALGQGPVPIGTPIANTIVGLLDPRGALVADGAVGELCIAGAGVALGYLGRPERTAERFVAGLGSGVTTYRTGDLARWRADGELEYLGRIDDQIKVHGVRAEPAEIEAVLLADPGVARAAVIVRRDEDPGSSSPLSAVPTLVGYVVPARGARVPTPAALAQLCRDRLPEQLVPKAFVVLDALPMTVNGKLNRAALPKPDLGSRTDDYVAPRTDLEEVLSGAVATVLGLDAVGIDDNYFVLGGDSIRSVMVASRAQARGVGVTVADVHAHPTVRRLAEHLTTRDDEDGVPDTEPFSLISAEDRARVPENVEDAFQLNLLQEGMIFHRDFAAKSAVYHALASLRLKAPWDHAVMRMAIHQLVERHPMLRTSFDMTTFSHPMQLVHTEFETPLIVEDLRDLPEAEREARVVGWVAEEKARGFELWEFPLIRFMVQRLSNEEWQFTYGFHHEIVDGWSEALMIAELFSQYFSVVYDEPISIKAPTSTMRDAVALEIEALKDPANVEFWDRYLADATMMRLPRFGRGAVADKGARDIVRIEVPVSVELSEQLKKIAVANAVPLKNVLMAGHMVVMSTYGGNADTLTYTVGNGRPESADGSTSIGLFVNSLALRVPTPGGTWPELIAGCLESERASMPYRRLPMAELKRHQGSEPLAETLFFFTNYHVFGVLDQWVNRGVSHVATDLYGESTFPFCAINRLNRETGDLEIRLEYDALQFSEELMDGVRQCYAEVFAALAADPDGRYDTRSYAPEADQNAVRALAAEPAAQAAEISQTQSVCLHQLFEQRARTAGDAVAVEYGPAVLTYRQLNRRADQLAALLLADKIGPMMRSREVGPETVVAILAERSIEQIVAVLGVLKAGAAYLPLDPSLPAERLAAILADAHCDVVIAQKHLASTITRGASVIALDPKLSVLDGAPVPAARPTVTPANTAYVIYTSGSTGEPKGVAVEHRNAVASTLARHTGYEQAAERYLLLSSYAFDSSIAGIFWTLTCGGTLVLPAEGLQREPAALVRLAAERRPTHTLGIPSLLKMVLDAGGDRELDSLRLVISAGEACPADLAEAFAARIPGAAFANEYGPTEATVWATRWVSRPGTSLGVSELLQVPIGRPVAGAEVLPLDHHGHLVPVGVSGELHIGGAGVARGYLGRPAATAAVFRPDPYGPPGARCYATGDVGRLLPEGELEFQGRRDHQVKIQGFRIELGAIEALLDAHPAIERSIVVARGSGSGQTLVGYVVPALDQNVEPNEVRTYVRDHLPKYMVPGVVVVMDAVPLTATGKVDRSALPKVDREQLAGGTEYVAPRDEIEEAVAVIWSKVLGVERVGVHEQFFDLGGESLRAMEAIAQTNKVFGTSLSVRQLFEAATVGELAAEVGKALLADGMRTAREQ
jgi:amino acid adenylation domain-containing protein